MQSLTFVKILGLGVLVLTVFGCGATPYMIAASPAALATLGAGLGVNAVAAASRPPGERYRGSNVTQMVMDRIVNGPLPPETVSASAPVQQMKIRECIAKSDGTESCTTRTITTTAVPANSVLETGESPQPQTISVGTAKPPPTGPACLQTGKCNPLP